MLGLTHESKSIDTQGTQYHVKFMNFSEQCNIKVNDVSLRIEMSDQLEDRFVAICYYQDNLIQVNRKTWKRLNNREKEQTIFHELGHCLLNQRHNDEDLNIMRSVGFIRSHLYEKYYDYFVRRLFIGCEKPLYEKFVYKDIK